ncbi:MAG TPA: phosphotransferase [Rhizomicrobium sp.]|jgi:hypothetical protein|nr:phosphotransferase [Rhizomicrobium sp.]
MITDKPMEGSVQELVTFLVAKPIIPRRLYPGGAKVTWFVRIAQIAFGWSQLAALRMQRRSIAVIYGSKLAYSSGWVTATMDRINHVALLCLQQGQPFVPVPMSGAHFVSVFERLGIDYRSSLLSYLSDHSHLAFRGYRADVPSIVHFGLTKESQGNVKRHLSGLSRAHASIGSVIGGIIPRVLFSNELTGNSVLVEDELRGATLEGPLSRPDIAEIVRVAMAPLQAIQRMSSKPAGDDYAESMLRELSLLEKAVPNYCTPIRCGLARLKEWMKSQIIQTVPTHGDYAPRNVFFSEKFSAVRGIVDWEWYWEDGPVGFDAVKFLLEVEAIQERTSIIRILAQFLEVPETVNCAAAEALICDKISSSSVSYLWHIGLLVWLRILWMGVVVTKPVSDEWLRDAVLLPALAAESWYCRIRKG